MARSHAATTCVQSDSIKGMAQSIAKPAYHRLLIAEPALRRAVPTLIIAFLITICIGAFVQVIDQTRQKRASMKRDLSALADLLAERLDRAACPSGPRRVGRAASELVARPGPLIAPPPAAISSSLTPNSASSRASPWMRLRKTPAAFSTC